MRAGNRTESIVIKQLTVTSGHESGEDSESWVTLATVWAAMVSAASGERPDGVTVADDQRAVFRFPNNAPANTVTADDRVEWRGRTMLVEGVTLAPGQAMEMQISCAVIMPVEA